MSVRTLLGAGALAAALAAPLAAQTAAGYNPRDDQYRLLGLVRAQADFKHAETEYGRARELHERSVISEQELAARRAEWERARVNYLQQSLAAASTQPHIAVERAVKSRGPDGGSRVRLALRNTTGPGAEAERLEDAIDPALLAQLRSGEVREVYVSLKAEPGPAGAIISAPYERRIARLRSGQAAVLEFGLLRDADEVVVSLGYGGSTEERKIYLEQDASADIVAVQSTQFSQVADLGAQATYDLRLERFTRGQDVFRLAAVGLPRGVSAEFRDPASGARLTQLRFPEGTSQRDLQLVVTLPRRAEGELRADQPIAFWAMALDPESDARLRALAGTPGGEREAASLRAGKARLEIVPRGIGRIEVRAANLYHEIRPGDSVAVEVAVRNAGSQAITGVRLRVDAPQGWEARTDPELVPDLPVGAQRRVRVTLAPPRGVTVGDYEARLRTESAAGDRSMETEDKMLRVHVGSAANWMGTGLLGLLLVGVVAGVVALGARLVRR
ncbi:MAG TPA: NEW3 domain-containing protein [Longimicrobiaceae bacterium]|nr:NEW3 domain-containing protein [Longimicrobiaceae bacterium]